MGLLCFPRATALRETPAAHCGHLVHLTERSGRPKESPCTPAIRHRFTPDTLIEVKRAAFDARRRIL